MIRHLFFQREAHCEAESGKRFLKPVNCSVNLLYKVNKNPTNMPKANAHIHMSRVTGMNIHSSITNCSILCSCAGDNILGSVGDEKILGKKF